MPENRSRFFLPVIKAINLWPFRPRIVGGALHGWPRQNLELHQAVAAVPHRSAHAIRSRIATAYHHHVFAFGRDETTLPLLIEQRLRIPVQEFHREMDSLERAAFDREIASLCCPGAKHDGIKL